jgi:DNA primase
MENRILLNLLESVLGSSKPTSNGNHSFHCPFCHHVKHKLEINLITNENNENPWHCWVCNSKGKSIKRLFRVLKVEKNKIKQLSTIITPVKYIPVKNDIPISLPEGFISLNNIPSLNIIEQIQVKHALKFLKSRNINDNHIDKYNIGICLNGDYENRIIIPSYDNNGVLNYFIARSYMDSYLNYKNPPVDNKNIIGFEYFINWNTPIILVEGIFDALTIQRNVIPLFGKTISEALMKKLILSEVDKIYIALDKDAQREALQHCQTLMNYGKKVYLVEMDHKDMSELGFGDSLKVLENTDPLTFEKLIKIKLKHYD